MSGVLDAALTLAAQGIPVFPCGANKRPAIADGHGFLDATCDPEAVKRLFARRTAKLIGVPTGKASGYDIFDVDYRHGGGDFEVANLDKLPETRMHGTLHGGRHYIFRHTDGVRNSQAKIAPGIDVRGDGGYACWPPSKGYEVISDAEVADWPAWLLELALARPDEKYRPPPDEPRKSNGHASPELMARRYSGFQGAVLKRVSAAPDGKKHVALLNAARLLGGVQVAAGWSDTDAANALLGALPDSVEDWKAAEKTARWALGQGRISPFELPDRPEFAAKAKANGHANGNGKAHDWAGHEAKGPVPEIEPDLWRDGLIKSETGKILRSLSNALIALREAPAWQGVLAWNAFSSRAMIMRALPGPYRPGLAVPREITDADLINITDWIQRQGIVVPSSVAREAILTVCRDNQFHPVREYLAGLQWDGVARIDMWLVGHLGADDTELHRAYGAKWLIGLVARVMKPGCQLDTAMILEGDQGLGKSTALATLAGPWFTDHLTDLNSKDALGQLQGVWIIELAELSSLGKAETHRVKAFLTTRNDRFRTPYGYFTADHPRQCGFAGTINPGSTGYLRDETGSRRFWPVACGQNLQEGCKINIPALAKLRDQLWAEAFARFLDGEPWHLPEHLEALQAAAADERQEDDPREPRIRDFISGKKSVRMDEILGPECLHIPIERWTKPLRMEIGQVMTGLRWRRYLQRDSDDWKKREWQYRCPEK